MPITSRRSAVDRIKQRPERRATLNPAFNLSELDPEQLLIETETAVATRRSPRTLESWRRDGVGPKWLKLGRSVCYRVGDLRDWLAAQECGGQIEGRRTLASSGMGRRQP